MCSIRTVAQTVEDAIINHILGNHVSAFRHVFNNPARRFGRAGTVQPICHAGLEGDQEDIFRDSVLQKILFEFLEFAGCHLPVIDFGLFPDFLDEVIVIYVLSRLVTVCNTLRSELPMTKMGKRVNV